MFALFKIGNQFGKFSHIHVLHIYLTNVTVNLICVHMLAAIDCDFKDIMVTDFWGKTGV